MAHGWAVVAYYRTLVAACRAGRAVRSAINAMRRPATVPGHPYNNPEYVGVPLERGECDGCHWHHLWPIYLGGNDGPLAPMSPSDHTGSGRLTSEMRRFMKESQHCRKCVFDHEFNIDWGPDYKGEAISVLFSDAEIRACLCAFFCAIHNRYPDVAAEFFRTHACPV